MLDADEPDLARDGRSRTRPHPGLGPVPVHRRTWPTGAKAAAASADPYFVHPATLRPSPPRRFLRAAIRSTAQRIGLDLPWNSRR
jgi:hypothetical protein